jgi:hypothetical protein
MDTFDAGFKVVSHASPPSTSMRGSLGGSLTPGFASPPIGSPSAAMARSASALVLPRSASLPAVARDGKSAPATASPLSTHGSPLGSINARGQSRIGGKWRSKPRLGDPSANLGNPAIIELPDGGTDTPLDVFEHLGKGGTPYALAFSQQLETLDRSSRLAQWMSAFAADEEAFASKAVFVEMRLRQALSSSVSLGVLERASNLIWTSALHARAHHGAMPCMQVLTAAPSVLPQVPNTFRIAVVCDAFERVAPLTGRYEGVLVLIWKELIRSIFADFTNDLPGQGAKAYAERTSLPLPLP